MARPKRFSYTVVSRTPVTITILRVKTCSVCKQIKPFTEMSKDSSWDGRSSRCKSCTSKKTRKWYKENGKESYLRNKEKRNEESRQWRAHNLERASAYKQEWYSRNRDSAVEYAKTYYAENKQLISEYRQSPEYKARHRVSEHNRRARLAELPPNDGWVLQDIISRDGTDCWMCGVTPTGSAQHIEHLVAILTPEESLVQWDIEHPGNTFSNVAVACKGCNSRKGNRLMLCAVARYYRNTGVARLDATW